MKRFFLSFIFLISASPFKILAMDYEYSIFFSPRFNSIHNLDELLQVGSFKENLILMSMKLPSQQFTDYDGDYPSAYFGGSLYLDFTDNLTFNFSLNSREISKKTIEKPYEGVDSAFVSRVKDNYLIDEANIDWYPWDWLYLKAGQQLLSVGNGDIIHSYQTGLLFEFLMDDITKLPLSLKLAFSPIDAYSAIPPKLDNFLYNADLSYTPGLFDEIILSYLFLISSDPRIIPFVYDLFEFPNEFSPELSGQGDINADGKLNWLGLSWSKKWAKFSISGAIFYEWGKVDYTFTTPQAEFSGILKTSGILFDADLIYHPLNELEIMLFLFFSSGEKAQFDQSDRQYHSFISLLPLITRTNIFFNGGINSTYQSGAFYSSGVLGFGVIAPGLGIILMPNEKISINITGASLLAHLVPLQYEKAFKNESDSDFKITVEKPGRNYGTEFDLFFNYEILDYLNANLEADIFFPGNFYPDSYTITGERGFSIKRLIERKPVTQVILGVELTL